MARARAAAVKVAEPATPLPTLIDDYLAHCRARGLSPNTVNQAYKYPLLGVLKPFCEREGIADVSAINSRVLDRLSAWLLESGGRYGQPLSPHSVHLPCWIRWKWIWISHFFPTTCLPERWTHRQNLT